MAYAAAVLATGSGIGVILVLDPRSGEEVVLVSLHAALFLFASITVGVLGHRRLTRDARAHALVAQHIAERYRLAANATSDAIWDWNICTNELAWNDSVSTLFGWKEAVHGTRLDWWQERLHPEDSARVVDSLHQAVCSRCTSWKDEYRFRCADGSYAEVIDRGWILRNEQGRAVRMIGAMLDATESKRAERALRESELRFRQLAENIRDVFWVMDVVEDRIIYASPGYERLWGLDRQALYQDIQAWESIVHPDDAARARNLVRECMEQGMFDAEYRIIIPDGSTHWVRDRGFAVTDEKDRRYRIAGIAEDITERRQAEGAQRFLFDIAERMGRISSPDALVETATRRVGEYLEVSLCLFSELDPEGDQILRAHRHGRGTTPMEASCSLAGMGAQTQADLQAGCTVVICDVATDPRTAGDWEARFGAHGIRAHASVPLLRDGRLTAMLTVTCARPRAWTEIEVTLLRAVAERAWLAVENARLLEQTLAALCERDASLRALRESDLRLSLALEAAHVVTCDWDLRDDVLYCSAGGWATLFGRPPAATTGASHGQELRSAIHVEDRAHFEDSLAAAIAERRDHHCEYRVVWPDGSIHWLQGRGRLFYDPDGHAVRMLEVLVDITDHKTVEAERALRLAREQAARAEAEAANRAKDEFLAMLSHELRNPLGAISNAAAVLGQLDRQEPMLVHAREVIVRQMRHLVGLVDDLLDVARVTSGKVVLRRRPVELAEAVRRCLATIPGTEGHRLTSSLAPVWIDGDENRVEQIVGNLVSNAIKYTPAGGAIDVTVGAEGAHAVVRVRDTGIGIPEDMLPRIFELFAQGRCGLDRMQGGLGIGLTLVKRLVELHGGSIGAASEGPGRGSTFTVHLPRILASEQTREPDPAASDGAGPRRCILVIEDNPDGREMLRHLLELAGHEVHVAVDGPGGVERALALQPDIVIIDIGLPGFDGYQVARRLRATEEGQAMILLALSGYGKDADRRAALAAGFDQHLVKPVAPDSLLAVLAAAGRSRATAAST